MADGSAEISMGVAGFGEPASAYATATGRKQQRTRAKPGRKQFTGKDDSKKPSPLAGWSKNL